MKLQAIVGLCVLIGLSYSAQGPSGLPDSISTTLTCTEAQAERSYVTCCPGDLEGTLVFCPRQCNNITMVCRCVDEEGNVIAGGQFFDDSDTSIDCIDTFPEEPTSPPALTTTMAPTTMTTTTMEPTQQTTTTVDPPEQTTTTIDPPTTTMAEEEPTEEEDSESSESSDSSETSESSETSLSLSESSQSSRSGSSMSEGTNSSRTDDSDGTDGTGGTDTSDGTDSSIGTTGSRSQTMDTTGPSRSRSKCVTVRKLLQRGCPQECLVEGDDGCPACNKTCYENAPEVAEVGAEDPCMSCTEEQVCLSVGRFGQRECVDVLEEGDRCDREIIVNEDGEEEEDDSSEDSSSGSRGRGRARERIAGAVDRYIFGQLSRATPPCAEGLVCARVELGRRECRPENAAGVCVIARETDSELDCATDGSFEPLQCRAALGGMFQCECVIPETGIAIPNTLAIVADPSDVPLDRCDSMVFQDCTLEEAGVSFTASHGEYFLNVDSCMRCLCNNGQGILCEPAVCRAISREPEGCEFEGQEYEHGEQFIIGCNRCGCRNGRIDCTHRTCEQFPIGDTCASCDDFPRSPVCAPNGKTYQTQCHAMFCGGYPPFDFVEGACIDYDICERYPCLEEETCIQRGGVSCLDPDGCDPDELRLCVDLETLQCEAAGGSELPGEVEDAEDEGENTTVCGTNGETYSSLCELLQDTGNEGVAYAGECDREECDGGEVCGTDGVTYDNICILRAQSGNARVDYYGECDVDEDDPTETPQGVCQRVSRARRCVYNASNCRRLVRPEEGCCALCGGIVFVAIDSRGLGEFVRLNPRLNDIDDFVEELIEHDIIVEEVLDRCQVEVSFTPSENLQISLEARTEDDDEFCGQASDTLAMVINNPDAADDTVARPQVLQFAGAAVAAEPLFQDTEPSGAPGLAGVVGLVASFAAILLALFL